MTAKREKHRLTTADLAYIAICTALMAVCSWISVPTVVPFTLQTFAVFCTLELLGGRRGTLAIAVYILLAAAGAPVLAGFSGGPGALFGLTGGYVFGFLLIGLSYRLGEAIGDDRFPLGAAVPGVRPAVRIVSLLLGLLLCYAFGTAWFMTVYAKQSGPIGLGTALGWCVLPFIIPDLLKLALAIALAVRLRKRIGIVK